MSKHTPGPWVTGNTDPLIFGRKQGNGTEPLGFVYGPSFSENSDYGRTALANARLICSAPDLLEALEALLNDVGRASSMLGAVKARAAIAKATGEDE